MAHDVLARRRNARAISFPPTCFHPRDAVPPGYALAGGMLEGSRASDVLALTHKGLLVSGQQMLPITYTKRVLCCPGSLVLPRWAMFMDNGSLLVCHNRCLRIPDVHYRPRSTPVPMPSCDPQSVVPQK